MKILTSLLLAGLLFGCSNDETVSIEEDEVVTEVTEEIEESEEAISFEEQAEIVKSFEGKDRSIETVDSFLVGAEKLTLGDNKYHYIDSNSVSNVIVQMNSDEDYVESVEYTIVNEDGKVNQVK